MYSSTEIYFQFTSCSGSCTIEMYSESGAVTVATAMGGTGFMFALYSPAVSGSYRFVDTAGTTGSYTAVSIGMLRIGRMTD